MLCFAFSKGAVDVFWIGFFVVKPSLRHHSFDAESLQQIEIKAQAYQNPFGFGFRDSSQTKLSDS